VDHAWQSKFRVGPYKMVEINFPEQEARSAKVGRRKGGRAEGRKGGRADERKAEQHSSLRSISVLAAYENMNTVR